MIRAVLFILKVSVLVFAAIWVADRPGSVSFEWLDNKITMHVGAFFILAALCMLCILYVHRIVRYLMDFPKTWKRYRREVNQVKGHRALTLGLSAVAAGDEKVASYQAYRASRLLPDDKGLTVLLEAQSERLQGNEEAATQKFLELIQNKDTAFLGVRGLLQSALDRRDDLSALALAEEALKMHPKQAWIVQTTYELQIRQRKFDQAKKTLLQGKKIGVFTVEKVNSDLIAILLYFSQESQITPKARLSYIEKAYALDKAHVPAATFLAKEYADLGRNRKAVNVIKKAWVSHPHPDFVAIWKQLMPKSFVKLGAAGVVKWFETLLELKPDSAEGLMAMAQVAMDSSLWGEARNYLKMAERIRPSIRLCKLYARLEELSSGDEIAVKYWLEKAVDMDEDRVWYCAKTCRRYKAWSPIAEPHGAFNTILWGTPPVHGDDGVLDAGGANGVLDAPKVA